MSERSKQNKSTEKSKVTAQGSKERCSKEKERTPRKQPMENVVKMEKLTEAKASPSTKAKSKASTSDKAENPNATKITSKRVSTASKPEDPEATGTSAKTTPEVSTSVESETPEVPKVGRMSKTRSEISVSVEPSKVPEVGQTLKTNEASTSAEPEAPKAEASEVPEANQMPAPSTSGTFEDFPEMCQIPETITDLPVFKFKFPEVPNEFRTSEILLELETVKASKRSEKPKTTSEMDVFTELETPEAPEVPDLSELFTIMSNISISDKSKNREAPEKCQMPKATSEMATSKFEVILPEIVEIGQMLETVRKISVSLLGFEAPKAPEIQMPKTMSEMITELESLKIPEITESSSQTSITTFQTSDKPEDRKVPEACQMPKTTSEASTSTTFGVPEVPEECRMAKTTSSTSSQTKESEDPELRQTRSMSKITVEIEQPKVPEVHRTRSVASQVFIPVKCDDLDEPEARQTHDSTSKTFTLTKSEDEINPTKDIKDDNPEIPTKNLKENSPEETKSFDGAGKKMSPVFEQNTRSIRKMIKRKVWPPISMPDFKEPHLVLATHHLVPSLPIGLFEVFAEMIEVVTKRPVVLLHECRDNRPIATEVVDIIVMPAAECWQNGVLLPASFVFEHPLNKNKSPGVYADVIVANDRASYIKDVMDLRGHKCAIPDKRSQFTAAGLFFNHLHLKGENMLFFGNIFDAKTQLEALEMVISKQAEVGVLESPVIRCQYGLLNVESLHVLTSIGPMPPYRIMVNESLAKKLNEELATYLLNIHKYEEWLERLLPFGVIGFAENSMEYYKSNEIGEKHVATSVPYY